MTSSYHRSLVRSDAVRSGQSCSADEQVSDGMAARSVPSLGTDGHQEESRGIRVGSRKLETTSGEQQGIELEDEESRPRGGGSKRVRIKPGKGTGRHGGDLEGEDSDSEEVPGQPRRSPGGTAERHGQDESPRTARRGPKARTPSRSECNSSEVADDDSRRRGPSYYAIGSGSDCDEHDGRRFRDGPSDQSKSEAHAEDAEQDVKIPKKSLYKWASEFVSNVAGRSQSLVDRVIRTHGVGDTHVRSEDMFMTATEGLDCWTHAKEKISQFDCDVLNGLPKPSWRQTVNIRNGEILEARPVSLENPCPGAIPGGPQDGKVSVWFGEKA